jgi:hypothetical protein
VEFLPSLKSLEKREDDESGELLTPRIDIAKGNLSRES